jgi:anti-sigma B factor antagonist
MTHPRFHADRGEGIVHLRGELDMAAQDRARRILLPEARNRSFLTLDLSQLTFCDSTGLNLMVEVLFALPKGGRLQVLGANRSIRKLFDVSGLSRHPAVLVRSPTPLASD